MTSSPLRVAIVGSGPAGFFTAEELLRCGRPVAITMFEKLAHPYGLIRYGVAPDHPNTRRIIKLLERTAAQPNFTLRAGVEVGRDVSVEDLRRTHDVIVVATGAEDDRELGIPGEDLPGVHSSLSFAGWVNGHRDFANEQFDFGAATAVIIGNGNVALDLVRMLSHDEAELRNTDIAPAAFAALAKSRVRTIHVIGRRGPAQASFGENEIIEIGALPGVDLRIDPVVAMLGPADEKELADPGADRARAVLAALRGYASRTAPEKPRRVVSFDFLRRATGITGKHRVESITLELCRLEGDPGAQRAAPTGSLQQLPCGLVFVSIGHHGRPVPGLPFDEKKFVIPTLDHRVVQDGAPIPGIYAVGWIRRGAKGLIGHNRRDAMELVRMILDDHV